MQHRSKVSATLVASAAVLTLAGPSASRAGEVYTNFETIPNRALELSEDGSRLFVTNVPDGRLEILAVGADGKLTPESSVQVGLDPVAVAVRSESEVWVVNFLSDSVSIVDVSAKPPRVVNTLFVGDEPRDIVFAGKDKSRAFITSARRGQNHPEPVVDRMQTPGLPRADVWVFDAANPGSKVGGAPLTIVPLFSDKPGNLTASVDGSEVFVGVFTSGNRTTTINDSAVCGGNVAGGGQASLEADGPCALPNGGMSPGGVPAPNISSASPNVRSPRVGIIVKFDEQSGAWKDGLGRDFRAAVPFTLPDNDVFVLDANANPPAQKRVMQHAGTLNFGLAAHPTNGKVYMATIDAMNTNRFLSIPSLNAFPNPNPRNGQAKTADPATGKTLNGHLYESRVAIMSPDGKVASRHLNKHIDYEVVPSPAGVKEKSVADPHGLAFSPDGETLFVAALGSNEIVPFKTAELDSDSFTPDASTHIKLTGEGGPTDVVFSKNPNVMFVYKRFDNSVAAVDVAAKKEVQDVALFNPEPQAVKEGRKFFYDARTGSSNGEANCNVCHPSADKDDLAWDLGKPFSGLEFNPNNFVSAGLAGLFGTGPAAGAFSQLGNSLVGGGSMPTIEFNPFKGPMTVLTLRGIRDSGPMFWRGDATVKPMGNTNRPMAGQDATNEKQIFSNGIPAVFPALLGRDGFLPDADFAKLTDWALSIQTPPNPNRGIDNVLNPSQARGERIFLGPTATDVVFVCQDCHGLDPSKGFFGTRGEDVVEGETQFFKVTQLRTVYDKVGGFGKTSGEGGDPRTKGGPRAKIGDQVRGFGPLHDGSDQSTEEFLTAGVFQLNTQQLEDVVNFTLAFPSNLASVVGQQVTLRPESGADVNARIDLFEARAAAPFIQPGNQMERECELVAKAVVDGKERGFFFQPASKSFLTDDGSMMMDAQVRALAKTPGQEVTFTCVYPGGGMRIGVDHDADGTPDGRQQQARN